MPTGSLAKVTAKTAAEVCRHFEPSEPARGLLKPNHTPAQYLDALLDQKHPVDAVKFLAQALPKREVVWWAGQCVRTLAAGSAAPAAAALKAAEAWVSDPKDENRRAALAAAETAQFGTPAGCVALAAFFSGGSLAPAGLTEVPPAENLCGHAAAGAIMLAVVSNEPENAPQKYQKCLERGVEIANGKGLWK